MKAIFAKMGDYLAMYGLKFLFALCIVIIGIFLTWFISFFVRKILLKTSVDGAVVTFITSIFKVCMCVIIILLCASVFELSTSGLIVSLSTFAIAIGLTLKDSFSNLANGILIIANKPFRRGDHISVAGVEGKVQNIKLLTVELVTFDNLKIVLPNSSVLNGNIVNYSTLAVRRCDMEFGVAYGSDMDKVEAVLKKVLEDHPKILQSMAITVYMDRHDASQITYHARGWTYNVDYYDVMHTLPRLVYDAFEKEGITIPFNQLDIHFDKESDK